MREHGCLSNVMVSEQDSGTDDSWLGIVDQAGSVCWVTQPWCHLFNIGRLHEIIGAEREAIDSAIASALAQGSITLKAPWTRSSYSIDWQLEANDDGQLRVYASPPSPPPDIARLAAIWAPVGVAMVNRHARLQFVNLAAARIFGQPRAQLVGCRFMELLPQADRAWAMDQHNRLIQHGVARSRIEHVIRRPSGEHRVIHIDQQRIELPEGPTQLASIADVTQERHATRRVSDSEMHLRDLMETIPGAVFQIRYRSDMGYRIDHVSEGLRAVAGFSADDELADFSRWCEWIPVSAREAFLDSLEESRTDLTAWTHEWPIETPTGLVWFQGVSQPKVEADGSVVWSGAIFDITSRKRTEERLDRTENNYRVLFDQTTEGLYQSSPDGQLLDVNWPLVRMHRCESKQDLIDRIADVSSDWYVDAETAQQLRRQVEASGAVEDFRSWIRRAGTGECFLTSESARAVRDGDGQLLYYQGSVRDVTDGELMNRLSARRSEILEMIARSQPIDSVMSEIADTIEGYQKDMAAAIYRVDDGRAKLQAAPSLDAVCRDALSTQAFGEGPDSAIGCAIRDGRAVVDSDCHCVEEHGSQSVIRQLGYADAIAVPIVTQSGTALGALAALSPTSQALNDQMHMVLHEMAQIGGIALEQNNLFERLLEKAQFDALTALPNRLLLDDRMRQLINDAERHDYTVAVLMLDLDEFKLVNDTLGHAAGDELLEQVAERLMRCMRASDTVARFGGDEFVIAMPLSEPGHASQVCERVLSELHPPIAVENRELIIRTSIGISLFPQDGTTPDVLLQAADTALYSAKGAGRNQYQYFADKMNERYADRLQIERELRSALERSQLELLCQPAVALGDQTIDGAEVLLRWRHPEHGLLGPGEFLPIAEQSSLIAEIDHYVIHYAAWQLACMQAAGDTWLISVNISARMLQSESFEDVIVDALQQSGASPEELELEITETVVMTDFEDAYRKLAAVKQRAPGIRVAIDDFGSGYSSLQYLSRLPIDTLKIDRGFIADLDGREDNTAASIIKTIIDLGHSLSLSVVGEGVEAFGQLERLEKLGCDRVQGFLFSAAVEASSFTRAARKSPSASGFRDAVDNG